ncbi:hypothetical protein [Actinomadura alba]|uniref:Uncharacterized protein n=1 Tax=Actinomadura alba TaxID=406431 RepID=A0ABR7LVA4_9ACTN|nr:hypothetical protein [Actinomadura alba]MBC6468773.1 hypothetical protein [Actinomadura alba]
MDETRTRVLEARRTGVLRHRTHILLLGEVAEVSNATTIVTFASPGVLS